MLFNSIDFAVFLPIVFALYWLIGSARPRLQNGFLVAASFLFYGLWSWTFLLLIVASIVTDYAVGRALGSADDRRIRWGLLGASLAVNLGMLAFFKYANFFIESFAATFSFFGAPLRPETLDIVLPVGISFYTFQTLSYTIDVYRGKLAPTRELAAFAAFVSFFPQLVAGPIERATHLLPQFLSRRTFDRDAAADGLRQMLWGLFKKIAIADPIGVYVNIIFDRPEAHGSSTLLLGAVFFAIQIYCDFSGYSDVAIGCARLFGLDLRRNFAFPYFARDVAEFWRRWHISLSTWFRDYLYIPLGGSRGRTAQTVRNVFVIFLVSGLWHGANWTFVAWGALHALYFVPLLLLQRNRSHLDSVAQGRWLPSARETLQMLTTFGLTSLAWVFFRAEDLSGAVAYFAAMVRTSPLQMPAVVLGNGTIWTLYDDPTMLLLTAFFLLEWFGRESRYVLDGTVHRLPVALRWSVYLALLFVMFFSSRETHPFIYFQF
ncbi:MAG: MBOAT family O-acyltransferase [Acidobacteriota bacterium]